MYKIRCCINRDESEQVREERIRKLKNNKCIIGENNNRLNGGKISRLEH